MGIYIHVKILYAVTMEKTTVNKIPRPATLARHFAKGMFCDYPGDIVCAAVNANTYRYDSVAIPIQLKFCQAFWADFEAYEFLTRHNSDEEISEFLASPNEFMQRHGVPLDVPLDSMTAEIMAVCSDSEFVRLEKTEENVDIRKLVSSERWRQKYTKRYPKEFFNYEVIWNVENVDSFPEADYQKYGFSEFFSVHIRYITRYLSEGCD